jgi:hypothetical protein
MLRIFKFALYVIIALLVVFFAWFTPKYSYVQKNPGFCVGLTKNLYYCGSESGIGDLFKEKK